MTKDEILDQFKDYPEIIDSSIEMTEANSPIKIFEGDYIIKNGVSEIKITGIIYYNWTPNSGANFYGNTLVDVTDLYKFIDEPNPFKIIINGLEFGQGFITNTQFGGLNSNSHIKGILSKQAVFGDKSIAVNKLTFSIPNLIEFIGSTVKKITEDNISISMNRLKLENDNYIIIIDKCQRYEEQFKSLKEKGGYIILYGGELTGKRGSITFEESKDVFHCLDTFLTFLNGRRTSALFIKGIYDNQTIWCDYTNHLIDSYKFVHTWPQSHSIKSINELWQNFSKFWQDNDNKNFLTSLIRWYVEANGNSGFSKGSLIMAQTALELLYNWWIIENKKFILGKDSETINASNKIRLLISQLNIPQSIPNSFTHLQTFVDNNKEINDAPEAIVQIRNAIVHSQVEKRKKLSAIDPMAIYEALQLCIWYIELSLLCILDYDDKYNNRCSEKLYISDTEECVPWTKTKQTNEK